MRKLDHNIMKCYSLRIPILGKGRKSNIHGGCLYVRCEPNGLILIRTSVLVRTKVLTLPPPKKKINSPRKIQSLLVKNSGGLGFSGWPLWKFIILSTACLKSVQGCHDGSQFPMNRALYWTPYLFVSRQSTMSKTSHSCVRLHRHW